MTYLKLISKKPFLKWILIVPLLLLVFGNFAFATDIRIVSWNVRDIFSLSDVASRADDLRTVVVELAPDILLIQEVTSAEIVRAIRDSAGLDDYYFACSDFVQSDSETRNAFEVAIISRFPFDQVIEYDPSPDNNEWEEDPEEMAIEAQKKIGISEVGTSRGFLWANISDLKLTVFVVHLKSSLGRKGMADKSNAEKRELVAAAVATGVLEDLTLFSGYAHLVAGDFNVGHSDTEKNGKNLKIDCYDDCGSTDLYDETHALLSEGIVGGLIMKNLVSGITTSTYPSYPGSPIDNIYVTGP